jgi:hypothetical protein
MNTIFQIIKQTEYDRYLFLHLHNGHIVGMNFHYDSGEEPMESYSVPDPKLTGIYLKLAAIEDEEQRINTSIDLFLFKKEEFKPPVTDARIVQIPQSQMMLVRNAIDFYLQAIQNLEKEYADERRHDIFDLNTLIALFNYSTSVQMTAQQSKFFGSQHGYDLPNYIQN